MVVLRAGLYERVSTDEQAIRGFSVSEQIDSLNEYCKTNKAKIVDHYTDAGVSGGKPAFKRPEMSRLLEDIKAGKIDIVLFTRLDRWFRNVKEYFKVQEILDENGVQWKAIHEDYDTTTSNGRMAITIFLAIAQNEREKNADRVRAVMANKRSKKEACFGGPVVPLGYMKQKDEDGVMRLVKNPETAPIVQDFWDYLIKYDNKNGAARMIAEKYGYRRTQKSWNDLIRSDFYCGIHKGVDDYCEPYVDVETWLKFQQPRSTVPAAQKNRVYLFSGMIRCPVCGRNLCGNYDRKDSKTGPKEYFTYRCRGRFTATCNWRKNISERKAEKYLLTNLDALLRDEIAQAEMEAAAPKPKPKYNVAALKEQLRRLDVMYMAGNKTDEEYLEEQDSIKALIAKAQDEAPPEPRDLAPLRELLDSDYRTAYNALDRENRRRFWRQIVQEIYVEGNNVVGVKFF